MNSSIEVLQNPKRVGEGTGAGKFWAAVPVLLSASSIRQKVFDEPVCIKQSLKERKKDFDGARFIRIRNS